jgi:DNA-binding MarR family transcriptional regulator
MGHLFLVCKRHSPLTFIYAKTIIAIAIEIQGDKLMKLDDSLGFVLNNAARKTSQVLSNYFRPYDITTEQWTVLNRLAEGDGISQKELSLRSEKDPTNVTRILDQLERKGLIKRKMKEDDRRAFLAFITEEGIRLNQALVPIEQAFVESLLSDLSQDQIVQLQKMLIQITNKANLHILEMEEQH